MNTINQKDPTYTEVQLYDIPNESLTLHNYYDKNRESKIHKKSILSDYFSPASVLSGFFFSGVGYTIGATGSILKDGLIYICTEIPKIPQYLLNGIDQNTAHYIYKALEGALANANYCGGLGATIGFFGGSILILKLKNSIYSLLHNFGII